MSWRRAAVGVAVLITCTCGAIRVACETDALYRKDVEAQVYP